MPRKFALRIIKQFKADTNSKRDISKIIFDCLLDQLAICFILENLFPCCKGEHGNKLYELELMLCLYVLQKLYTPLDERTVAEDIDSRTFSEFCGVESSNQVLNGDELGGFRNLLICNGLHNKLFDWII